MKRFFISLFGIFFNKKKIHSKSEPYEYSKDWSAGAHQEFATED